MELKLKVRVGGRDSCVERNLNPQVLASALTTERLFFFSLLCVCERERAASQYSLKHIV